jgi:threonine aldolase
MRFLAAPWIGLIESDAWIANAAHSNRCARYFADHIAGIPDVKISWQIQANAVFINTAKGVLDALRQRGWKFCTFIGACARFIEEKLFKTTLPPEEVAAIILEPIQGEGGYIVAPDIFLKEIRNICDRHGIMLIADAKNDGNCGHRDALCRHPLLGDTL